MTNRERVEAHTGVGTCGAACHATVINPPGYAFEHYDALGQYRTTDNGQPVDAAASYSWSDGEQTWVDGVEFAFLMADHIDTHTCYTMHWLEYLLGREAEDSDAIFIDPIAAESQAGLSVQDLIVAIVTSDAFRYRVDEGAP